MDLIVEKMAESKSLVESWGEVIDVTEFMTDSSGFFNTNGLGAFTQIYDRADGRYRPVYTNESDLKLIRAMSWLLVEKVPMAQAWVNRLLDYTIGTGFDWTIKADDKRLEKAIQLYVRESLDVSNWSTELERESYMREVADGEFIGEHIYEDGQCMVVSREADELTEPAIKGELEEWLGLDFVPSWTFGVLTKESLPERPIGYHFVRNSAGTDWDYVPADRVCMWKRNVRSRGKRGFSDFYKPHLYLLRADRVLTNTAEGAATQAAIAYIVEHRDGTQRQADNIVKRFAPPTGKVDPLTGLAQRRRRMLPGTRLDVPEGQAYKAGLLGSNNSGIYIEVMESALRLAGSVHAFVEGMLTGSYANNNFASALVAEGPFMQGRLAEQSQRKERMRDMILKIIKLGASKGRFRSVGFDSWDAVRDRVTVEVIPSRIIPVDPLKTAQALAIQKQNGWVSDKTCINELGRDPDTETANGLKIGGAENQPGADGQPGAAGPAAGQDGNPVNVSKNPEPESSLWLGLSRQQWQRNRKAVSDVLTDFADGKTRRSVAVALLRAIGMPEQGIQTILRDASDGQIDSLPPEQMESVQEAERKTLNRPFRTSDGPKKFAVYVKNEKGNVIRLGFGDPKMKIKRDNPGSRRGFRARHNCQDPGPKYKARYWSCRFWSKPSVSKLLRESVEEFIPWDGRTFVRESWLLKTNPRLIEVRCPTGKGGGIDNSCKRKNKSNRISAKRSDSILKVAEKINVSDSSDDKNSWVRGDGDEKPLGSFSFKNSNGSNYAVRVSPATGSFNRGLDQFDAHYLEFADGNDSRDTTGKAGTAQALETFDTVSAATVKWLKSESPEVLTFQAREPNRAKLYKRLSSTAAAINPDYAAYEIRSNKKIKTQKEDEYTDFILVQKGRERRVLDSLNAKGIDFSSSPLKGSLKAGSKISESNDADRVSVRITPRLLEGWYRTDRLLEVRDGDGDGKINDGKSNEAPAPPKEPKASKSAVDAPISKAVAALSSKAKGKPLAAFLNANNAENFGPAWDKAGPQAKPIHGIDFSHENVRTNKLFPSEYDSWDEDPSDPSHVSKLAAAFKSGEKIKPVLVHLEADGATVLDGHHRVKAAMQAGVKDVPVIYTAESLAKIWKDANSDVLKPETKAKSASKLAKEYADFRLRSAVEKKESLTESLTEHAFTEAFCATGKKGGVKNDCPPKRTPKAPAKPKFVSSDRERNLENDKVINGMLAMFNDADMAGLQSVEHPSPKVMEYSKALQRALHASGVKGGNPIDLFGSSSAMHQRGGVWTDERRELHAEIYNKLLAGAEPVSNPVFVLLGGGSASGKSTLTAGGLAEIPGSIVRVDSDQIKAMLPEYAEASGKDARAAAFVHDESAYMAKELAAIASGRGYNTMLDGTGNGSEGGLAGKVGIARDRGMKVVAVYATTDLDTALKRNAERAKTDGRMVPNSFLRYSHSQVSALFPRFVANGSFDEAHLYDTTVDAKKIATYQNGSLEVHDPKAYRKFLDKAGR